MAAYNGLFKAFSISLFVLLLVACGDKPSQLSPLGSESVVVAFGDSLTYGYGADSKTESYPAVLEQLLGVKVVNQGVSGEVSQDGLIRLQSVLAETNPELVILCHGGNDLIRKLSQQSLKSNLDQMIQMIKASGAEVMLIAVPNFSLMLNIPPLYSELAETHQIPIQMDILKSVESDRALKSDQVHPNAQGYRLMAEKVFELLQQSGALAN